MKFTLNASGAQAAGQGIGNMVKAFALAPQMRQQAEMQTGHLLAQTDQAQAHASKFGEEARGLRITNDAREAPIDPSLPEHLRLPRQAFKDTGDTNMERYVKSHEVAKKMGLVDSVIADPSTASSVGKAYAAVEGKPLFNNVGNTGQSIDNFTGGQFTASPGLYSLFKGLQESAMRENNAQAQNAMASAGAARATTDLRRAQTAAVGQSGGKAPAGYRWASDPASGEPMLQVIPGGPADKSGAPTKVGAEVQRQIGGIISVQSGLDALEQAMADYDPRSPRDRLSLEKMARIRSIAKQVQLDAKEAAALGALSGPDMGLLEGILADPTSLMGGVYGRDGISSQIQQARLGNQRRIAALKQQYGGKSIPDLPEPARQAPSLPKAGAQPTVSNW